VDLQCAWATVAASRRVAAVNFMLARSLCLGSDGPELSQRIEIRQGARGKVTGAEEGSRREEIGTGLRLNILAPERLDTVVYTPHILGIQSAWRDSAVAKFNPGQ
jgi:hypothetical protein